MLQGDCLRGDEFASLHNAKLARLQGVEFVFCKFASAEFAKLVCKVPSLRDCKVLSLRDCTC